MNVLNENTFSFFNNKSNLDYFGDWINNIENPEPGIAFIFFE